MDIQTKDLILMMKDTAVMRINLDSGIFDVLSWSLLPYQLRGYIAESHGTSYSEIYSYIARCYNGVISFLGSRTLPLDRENAKKILNLLHAPQGQDLKTKTMVALMCRAVTLQDNYWVKLCGEDVTWCDVDLRQNHLSDIVAQVALHGRSLTIQGKVHTPELTTHGAYAKAWRRCNGKLYLYKRSYRGGLESEIEVEVSHLLDKCNVKHLKYEKVASKGVFCCRCECLSTQSISMLSVSDFNSYFQRSA